MFFPSPPEPRRFAVTKSFADYCFMRRQKIDLPSVHGEISVEHLFAHLFPLNSAGKFQVRELVSQQVRLHESLRDGVKDGLIDAMTHSGMGFCHKADHFNALIPDK